KRNEHVNGFSRFNVRLIRECRTSEHGERACERQYQCENLFLMAGGKTFCTNKMAYYNTLLHLLQLFQKFFIFHIKDINRK
ncbi:MAG: hypothetical protein ACOYIE_09490, partial [Agathobaculum sp.]|uniref:hypothetical protein n=1 Tax=Agathobaculum sp. TaxID=2048138 RepID=UPI003D9229D4